MLREAVSSPRIPIVFLGIAVGFSLLGDMSLYVVLPVAHEALGLSPLQVGILLSANRWVRIGTNHLARSILERREAPVALTVVLVGGAAATAAYALAPGFGLFLVARMVWGLCWSFIRHIGVMTSVTAGEGRRAAGVLGLYTGVVQAGFVVGTMSASVLFDTVGYRLAFLGIALVSLIGIPFELAAFRTLPHRLPTPPRQAPDHPDSHSIWMLIRGFIASCVSIGLIVSTLGFALKSRFGDAVALGPVMVGITSLTGALIAAHYAIGVVGAPPIGAVIDRIGRRTAEIVGFTAGFLALTAAGVLGHTPVLVPSVILFFVATVACKLSLFSGAGAAGSSRFAHMATASDLGAAAGPLVGWIAIERLGSADAVFAIGAALYAVAAISALRRSMLQSKM
ncbi:MAG: MFS transporter [Spirochaetaceae bacterium]|nr:MAG: MFS transporter [Spirochaetaceae bacterium]